MLYTNFGFWNVSMNIKEEGSNDGQKSRTPSQKSRIQRKIKKNPKTFEKKLPKSRKNSRKFEKSQNSTIN